MTAAPTVSEVSTWIYLIRHGEVEGAGAGRFFGQTDVGLSPAGLAQVNSLARALAEAPIEAVYASDLLRARQSAGPLAAARGVVAVTLPALREMAMGEWEGLTFAEMRERDPNRAARWLADPVTVPFPKGENLEMLRARVIPAMAAVITRHAGRRAAVVAHGGPNRVALAEALGLPLANLLRLGQDYAGLNLIEYQGAAAVVHLLNQRVPDLAAPSVETTLRT